MRLILSLPAPTLLASLLLACVPLATLAQSPAQDRVYMDQTLQEAARIVGQTGSLTVSTSTDEDSQLLEREFGTQKLRPISPRAPQWQIALEAGGFYTSNAVLAPFEEQQDWVGRSVLRAAWAPAITKQLSGLVSTSYGAWRYADLDFLDFDDLGAQAGLVWRSAAPPLAAGLPSLTGWAQYRYNRLIRPWEWSGLLYETHLLEVGARQAWSLTPDMAVWVGGNAAFSVEGQPDLFRRSEYSAQAGGLWMITPRLMATVLYRAAIFDYLKADRQDVNHLLHAGISWQVARELRVDFFVSGTLNDSDISIFDYEVMNVGLNLMLSKMW